MDPHLSHLELNLELIPLKYIGVSLITWEAYNHLIVDAHESISTKTLIVLPPYLPLYAPHMVL